jgi:hypothetical protein
MDRPGLTCSICKEDFPPKQPAQDQSLDDVLGELDLDNLLTTNKNDSKQEPEQGQKPPERAWTPEAVVLLLREQHCKCGAVHEHVASRDPKVRWVYKDGTTKTQAAPDFDPRGITREVQYMAPEAIAICPTCFTPTYDEQPNLDL